MPIAFVYINAEPNGKKEVLEKLRAIPEVKYSYEVDGIYDIIAKVEAKSLGDLTDTISERIKKIDRIRYCVEQIAIEE